MRIVVTLAIWMTAWLLWSGLYKPLLITLGAISCLLVLVIAQRMGFFARDFYTLRLTVKLLPYWIWLLWEIIKSNLQVARIILTPDMPISPTVVRIDALDEEPLSQAVLANSITLTPGSVTIDDHEAKLFVHCLTKAGAETLLEGEMNRRVAKLSGS